MISVCIPVYNAENDIRGCIESVQKQSFTDIEILVQDNDSTDKTWEIVQEYAAKDQRIKPERNAENVGMVINFNLLAARSKGDYIAFIGADDRWNVLFLERCFTFMKAYFVEMVGTNYDYLRKGKLSGRKCGSKEGIYYDYRRELLTNAPMSLNAMLISRNAVTALTKDGMMFPTTYSTFDFEMWIRASNMGMPMYYSKELLVYIGAHGNSSNMGKIERQEALVLAKYGKELRKAVGTLYLVTILRRLWVWFKRSLLTQKFDFGLLALLLRQLVISFIPKL